MNKYPLADEYHQALQNPIQCFSDYQLRYGSIQSDALGLPRVRSGNFASVYKVYSADGDYAVKCFLNSPEDLDHRYECIGQYLWTAARPPTPGMAQPPRQAAAPGSHAEPLSAPGVASPPGKTSAPPDGYFIKFKYYRKGISVNGGIFPLLRMEWADGVSLDRHISGMAERYDRQAILDLREKFVELYAALRARGISHGDLQHGNILVTKDGLKLIDYDGMYVPTVRLSRSDEVGHPNYQHPKRKPSDYNELGDGFSVLVIYTALSILAYDPGYWRKFYNGDNILFTEKDFLNTNQSPLFRRIKEIPIDAIREATNVLAWSCLRPFEQMPDVLEIVGNTEPARGVASPSTRGDTPPLTRGDTPPLTRVITSPGVADAGMINAGAANAGMQQPAKSMPARAGRFAITCPSCRGENDESAALCGRCAYPLSMSSSAANDLDAAGVYHPSSIGGAIPPPGYLQGAAEEAVVCPKCNSLNEQSLAFCKMCGLILSNGPGESTEGHASPAHSAAGVDRALSLIARFKLFMVYFVLFFFLISAMDYARNERIGPFAPITAAKARPLAKPAPPDARAPDTSPDKSSPDKSSYDKPGVSSVRPGPKPPKSQNPPKSDYGARPSDLLKKLLRGM